MVSSAAGCADCHDGPRLTNNATVDIGHGRTQVPSLVGVSFRLPVMRSGCATTLEQRFELACGGRRHGQTDGLAPEDLAALTAYLESL